MIRYIALLFIIFILSTNSQNVIELTDANFDSEVTEEDWLINFYTKDCAFYDDLEKWSIEKKLDLRFGQINAVKEAYLISTFHLKNLTAPFWILTKNWTENFVLEGESNLNGLKEFLSGEYNNSKIPLFYEMFDHDQDDDEEDEEIKKEEQEEINSYLKDEQKKIEEENKKKENKDIKNANKGSASTSKDSKAAAKPSQDTSAQKPKVVMKEYKEVDKRAATNNNGKTSEKGIPQQDKKNKTDEDDEDDDEEKPSKNTKTESEKTKDSKDDSKEEEEEEFKWPYDPDTIVLTSNNFELKTSTGLWLVDFYAPWCPHCQELSVVWAKLATRVKKELAGRVNIAKIDVDKHEAISSKYNVEYLPSIVYFRSGMMYTYEGEHNEDDLIRFMRKDYKKTQGTKTVNEFVKRAPEPENIKFPDRGTSNGETSEPSFLNSICNRRCQRFLLNPLFISSLLLAMIGLFVFLLVKKPSDEISFVKKSRRKKKIV